MLSQLLEAHPTCLVAVSGGSDSIALMHLVHDATRNSQNTIAVATVDHGLRSEAAAEAAFVAREAAMLGFPHETLVWSPTSKSAESAREARYDLLVSYARRLGATAILLGHNLDDQAETVLMRARRATGTSATRGLSAIAPIVTHERLLLARPLLDRTRQSLRDDLIMNNRPWIEDPSNENRLSERVRVRQALAVPNDHLPSKQALGRLAALAARTRAWMAQQTADLLSQAMHVENGTFVLDRTNHPFPILQDAFAVLTMAAGGLTRRVPRSMLLAAVTAHQDGQSHRSTAGRALISVDKKSSRFERENRALPQRPGIADLKRTESPYLYDGRELLWLDGHTVQATPFISGLERFRPASDDAVAHVLSKAFQAAKQSPSLSPHSSP